MDLGETEGRQLQLALSSPRTIFGDLASAVQPEPVDLCSFEHCSVGESA